MMWVGPYTVDELLECCFGSACPQPPEANGVYLISERPWKGAPTRECLPLFVGSNTQNAKRFRLRIGHLIADMFGFFGAEGGNSSGGQSLHRYCMDRQLNPKTIYIGWLEGCTCPRCTTNEVYDALAPRLNKRRPARCDEHPRSFHRRGWSW